MTKAYKLLSVLLEYAPSSKEQEQVTKIYNVMREACGDKEILLEIGLVGILHDGLNYGNWPWAIKDLTVDNVLE
jgi:hypothetical protein